MNKTTVLHLKLGKTLSLMLKEQRSIFLMEKPLIHHHDTPILVCRSSQDDDILRMDEEGMHSSLRRKMRHCKIKTRPIVENWGQSLVVKTKTRPLRPNNWNHILAGPREELWRARPKLEEGQRQRRQPIPGADDHGQMHHARDLEDRNTVNGWYMCPTAPSSTTTRSFR